MNRIIERLKWQGNREQTERQNEKFRKINDVRHLLDYKPTAKAVAKRFYHQVVVDVVAQ